MSVLARWFSNRRRRPTSRSRPRRLWWSCLCILRCSVRSLIRRVSIATWTSGEPVSFSTVAYSVMICFLTALSSAIVRLRGGSRVAPGLNHGGSLHTRRSPDVGTRLHAEDFPGVGDVLRHGGQQGVHAGERCHRPQALHELDADVLAVEVVVVIEHERLDRAPAALER